MIVTTKKDIPDEILEKYPNVFKMIKYKDSEKPARLSINPELVYYETNENNPYGNTHGLEGLDIREYFEAIPPVPVKVSKTFGLMLATFDGNHRIRTIKNYNDLMEELGLPKAYLPIELILE